MKTYQFKIIGLFVCYLLGFHTINAQIKNSTSKIVTEAQLDEVFADWKDQNNPGMAVSVIKDGDVVYSKGFGSANLEYDIPITTKTIFHSASLSKQFTAFAILLLEAEGKLSLDDDVRKYIPEVPNFGKTITLRHLASHSSGLRDQWRLLNMAGYRIDDVITTKHIMKLVARQKALNFDPGDEDSYSNTGFTLLAEVVARVSGQSFAEFTNERIFMPLNMDNTQFYDDHEKIVKNRAYSYSKTDNGYKKRTLSFATVGPTSLFITAEDFTQWALNFENPKVGSKAIIEKLNTRPELNNGKKNGFALGQIRGLYQGIEVFVHSGSDAGYRAYFVRIPEHKLSVIVLANLSSISPIDQAFGIVNLYLSDMFKEQEERAIFQPDSKTIINLSRSQLEKFAGDYWEPKEGYKRKIFVKNDTLIYYRSENSESKLVPIAANKFKMLDDTEDVTIVFNNKQNGEPQLEFFINDNPPLIMLRFTDVSLNSYQGSFYSEELSTSYSIEIIEGKLVARHSRLDDIEFSPIQKDVFSSKERNYKGLEFVRSEKEVIIGLTFSNGGARNVWFEKKE